MKSEYVLIHAAPIKHYGIKGQKKGVRRYQLDNGQLTAAGKIRYYNTNSNNGGRPYSTPYTQETANGRKKNVTGTTSGASANKSSGVNAAKASDTAYAVMAKAIDPVEKANAKVEAQRKKQEEVNAKRNTAIETAAYNAQTKYGTPKKIYEIASGTNKAVDDAVRKSKVNNLGNNGGRPYSTPYTQGSSTGKSGNSGNKKQVAAPTKFVDKENLKSEAQRKISDNTAKIGADLADKASDRVAIMNAVSKIQNAIKTSSSAAKQMDNGAVDTLKKKDLVKIKSGKNTRR